LADTDHSTSEHEKTVFARFSLAYYIASVFETGLALAIVQLEFLTSVKGLFARDGRHSFDSVRYRADFDAFLEQQQTKTQGALLKRVEGVTTLDPPLKALVSEAKAKRNFLGHHYFRERAEQFIARPGRDDCRAGGGDGDVGDCRQRTRCLLATALG
jgi:hypothetical protein